MDDCSDEEMAALASTRRPRPAMPAGHVLSANRDDWTLAHLRGQPLPDAEAIVYVLAFARRQTFYVDVAKDIADAIVVKYRIDRAQQRQFGKRGVTPLYCVYIECHASQDTAEQRCAAIKALPHAWQRCIIDRFNPAWLSMANELIAFPCFPTVRRPLHPHLDAGGFRPLAPETARTQSGHASSRPREPGALTPV
jgi:predicted GIY-YIG superfamily endonuclease